jgi:xanthosine utilization system XapX-like protein
MHAICTGIGINLGRIHRYLVDQEPTDGILEGLRGLIGDMGLLGTQLLKWGQKLASYPFTVKYFI